MSVLHAGLQHVESKPESKPASKALVEHMLLVACGVWSIALACSYTTSLRVWHRVQPASLP
jgi:hypothetical protein